ncbi:MAG: hypothetical protein CSA05_02415 [Bacteroidia bacterium]|nr:MAG: hypothetical protein CSA05_02415 [Bacteroidia bacterium]
MEENQQKYSHSIKIQKRFTDFDRMHHVNNSKQLTFFETARIDYFLDVLKSDADEYLYQAIIARNEIDYLKPISIDAEIKIFTRCAKIGNKSITLEAVCLISTPNKPDFFETASKCVTVVVAYDYENEKTIYVPERMKQLLLNYEKAGTVNMKQTLLTSSQKN